MEIENQNMSEEVVEETPAVETPPAEEPVSEEVSEAKLAEEALTATDEPVKVDPKDAVIGGFRRQLRDAEIRAARAEGALAAKVTAPPEKSPIDLAAEKQEVSVDEVVIDGKLYREQQAWEKRQAGNQVVQQQVQDYQSGSEAALLAMTDENLGKGLGLESLGKVGEHLLTDQDRQEIYLAGKKCGTVLYKKLKERIFEAGEEHTEGLRKRFNLPPKSQSKPNKEKSKTGKTKLPGAEEVPEPPSAVEVLDIPTAQIGNTFDL